MYDNEQYFFEALKAGASGYVLKSVADRDLLEACRATLRGEPFLYAGAVTALIRDYLHRARQGDALPDTILTPREEEVLKLIAEGYSTREIATTLGISAKTVDRHRTNTLAKLGLRDRLALTRYAIRAGLIEPRCRWLGASTANRIGSAWPTTPMPAPRIGQIGQKYQAPAVSPTASHTVSTMTTIAR